jgi:hypothetical protein
MIGNVHNGECCVRTYGTNRRSRTLLLMVASGLMPFGFRRQYGGSRHCAVHRKHGSSRSLVQYF